MDTETTTTVESTDNSSSSEISLEEQIDKVFDEPEPTTETQEPVAEEPAQTEKQDNTIECPEKFKNEDGSINVQNLLKSYIGLEPIVNQKAALEKENAELLKAKSRLDELQKQQEQAAQQAGFSSASDMQQSLKIAKFEADQYSQYLQLLDDETRVTVEKLLNKYSNNPSAEIMKEIEVEFAPEINKLVAIQKDRLERQFESEKEQQAETTKMSNIENVISKSIESNSKLFDYEPFKNLFLNTLYRYGDNFTCEDAEALMSTMVAMKSLYEEEFKANSASLDANKNATDKLAAITGQGSATSSQVDNVDLNKITSTQLDKLLDKYI